MKHQRLLLIDQEGISLDKHRVSGGQFIDSSRLVSLSGDGLV